MTFQPPARFNIADYFLDDRLREGRGDRVALRLDEGELTYAEVSELANRYGHVLRRLGVRREERVLICLPDGPEFVAVPLTDFGIVQAYAAGEYWPDAQQRPDQAGFSRRTVAEDGQGFPRP